MSQPDPNNPLRVVELQASDPSQVADLHRKAYGKSLLSSLGRGMVERYIRWQFARDRNKPCFVGAFDGDQLVGYLSGGDYTENIQVGFLMDHRGLAVRNTLLHPMVLFNLDFWTKVRTALRGIRRYRHLSENKPEASSSPSRPTAIKDNFHVLSVAVDASARRLGVGRRLMEAAEEQAESRHARTMNAAVQSDNTASLALFKRSGFEVANPGSTTLNLVKRLS